MRFAIQIERSLYLDAASAKNKTKKTAIACATAKPFKSFEISKITIYMLFITHLEIDITMALSFD